MQHDDLTMKLERAASFLKNDPLAELALHSCGQCGMTYLPLLQQLSRQQGLKHGAASLRRTLKELTLPVSGVPPMLQDASLRVFGRSGAPTAVFIPTEFGRQVLEHLNIKCPNPHNEAARRHLYIQMELVTRALQVGWTSKVEKHLATVYADYQQNIRIDVFIEPPGEHPIYLEAEQELSANNFSRAEEKFEHWQNYAHFHDADAHFRIVFNVPRNRLGNTLHLWRKALTQLDDTKFQVSYALLADLMDIPLDEAIMERFSTLSPLEQVDSDNGDESAGEPLSKFAIQVQNYSLESPELDEWNALIIDLEMAEYYWEKLPAFLALMRFIYGHADLKEDGEGYQYNVLPVKALHMIHRYLTHPDNQSMYEELKLAIRWAQGRSGMGVTMLKHVYTSILWDVVLAHHGFARGGQLKVDYEVPDHMRTHSQFGVAVEYKSKDYKRGEVSEDEAALAWVLNALFLYAEPLGLGRLPWKKKPKGGDA
jgi:hypothetical protein